MQHGTKFIIAGTLSGCAVAFGLLWVNGENIQSSAFAQAATAPQVSERSIQEAERLSDAFRSAAKILNPSVVTITSLVERSPQMSRRNLRGLDGIPEEFRGLIPDEFFDDFGRRGPGPQLDEDELEAPQGPTRKFQTGVGSGVIVSSDGYILTNNHVVEQADELQVELSDGRGFEATIVGTDEKSDVAVLKIEANDLVAARLGDSSLMDVGDWVIAIGSPFGLDQTVTAGIISATHRVFGILNNRQREGYEDFLQTDAAINPGNSGGPLVNLRGEVVGINTAINSRSGTNAGVGFAIPSNMAARIMEDLRDRGRVVRGYVGISIGPVTYEQAQELKLPQGRALGAYVAGVQPGGPADKAALQAEDVITAVNGMTITSSDQFRNMVALTRPGTKLELEAYRKGRPVKLQVTVGELTEEKLAQFRNAGTAMIDDLGIRVMALTPRILDQLGLDDGTQGVVVVLVDRSGLGYRLGLRPEDIISRYNGQEITTLKSLEEAVSQSTSDDYRIVVQREGQVMMLRSSFR